MKIMNIFDVVIRKVSNKDVNRIYTTLNNKIEIELNDGEIIKIENDEYIKL